MPTTHLTRRRLLTVATALPVASVAGPKRYLVDWTHLFGDDRQRFPYHKYALNQAAPKPVESYSVFARSAGIDHCVIIHSEVYQDDHRYLEYCFEQEPWPGFFKATCLFDPVAPETPGRIEEIYRKYPTRIIGMRINVQNDLSTPPSTSGGVRNRDMRHPNMKKTWHKLAELGLSVEMQSIPCHTPAVRALKSEFPDMVLHLDHWGQPNRGTPAEYQQVLDLARLPRVYMRVEPLNENSGGSRLVRQVYDAFGPDHLLWSGFGGSVKAFEARMAALDQMFSFASEEERNKIRGMNTMKLFKFPM